MSVWKSIFKAELRRSRVFFLIFLLLKALYVAMIVAVLRDKPWVEGRQGWIDYVSPSLAGTGALCLVAFAVFRSAWLDSPTRGVSHLAFRPVRHRVATTALLAAWLLLFVLPSAVIEGTLIHHYQFPLRTVLLGSLQTGLVTVIVVLTVTWIVWMLDTTLRLALGAGLLVAACVHTMFVIAFYQDLLPGFITAGTRSPWIGLLPLPLTVLLGFLLLFLHSRSPIRGWVRVLAAPATVYGAMVLAGLIGASLPRSDPFAGSETPGDAQTLSSPAIVSASYEKYTSRSDPALLEIQPPAPTSLPVDQRVEWRLTKLSANGADIRDFQPDPRTTSVAMVDDPNLASYNALSRHLGDKIMIDRGISSLRSSPAQGQLRDHNEVPVLRDLSCELTGTVTRWGVSGDRLLRPTETTGKVLLNHSYFLWITPGDPFQSRGRDYLYSPTTGLLTEFTERRSFSYSGFGIGWMAPNNYDPLKRPYVGHRLISLRPETSGTIRTSVSIPRGVSLLRQDDNGRLPPNRPEAVMALETWLKEHPAPTMDAPEAVISAWLREFLPLIPLPIRQPDPGIRKIIGSVEDSHPVLLLETLNTLDDNSSWGILNHSETLPKSLLRETILRRIYPSAPRDDLQPQDEKLAQVLGPYAP